MPESLESVLSVRTGRLADALPLFDASTIQHSHEIMRDRRADASLRNQRFWTADFPMYRMEEVEAVLYFAPREHNLIFRDIQNATHQLLTHDNYVPARAGIDEVVAATSTGAVLKVKLSDLNLKGDGKEWRYFEIDTANPDSLNSAERAFAERVYGQGNEFSENMKTLQESEINRTRIYVLNPNYVQSRVKGDSAIGRASRLVRFDGGSWFYAGGRGVGDAGGGLRGVLKSAEGAAPQKVETNLLEQYTPEGILKYLSKNPIKDERFAAFLLNHVNSFYNSKA